MTWAATAVWVGLLSGLRAGTTDFALRPERWETRATLPAVEAVLRDPLSGPAAVDALGARVDKAEGAAGLISAGFESLGVAPLAPAPVPAGLDTPVGRLVARLTAAQTDLALAVASLTPEERVRARRAADAAVGTDPLARADTADFDAAARFDLPRLAAAGLAAARAVDEAIPELSRGNDGAAFSTRFESAIGTVIVSSGDAEFGPEDLAQAGLIVRLGGRTRYRGPAAAAGEGQVRVVIDLGGPAAIESTGPAGGSGDFGIGLLELLGPGPHVVDAGEYSLGSARFGVGCAAISGNGSKLTSRRFGQGAAAYGVGALDTRGDGDSLTIPMAGQGFGTTRGAGLWRHRGAGLTAACGFVFPDAREPLGSQSAGQGAGMGPRAFAAGGVGVAHVTGDGATLNASYFSQGSGYWHGLGALYVRGDDARLQSRRYGLGSGVHMAVGALDVSGKRARIAAWGVGPGFGWDYGVGLFRLRGDEARVRSDWADGRSDFGGRSLSWIEGDRDELALNDFGTGSFTRAQAGYGLAILRGRGGRVRAPGLAAPIALAGDLRKNPWGVLHAEGDWTLDPALVLPDPQWPRVDPGARAADEGDSAARLMNPAPGETERARMARLLFASSADILDPRPAEGAAVGLSGLNESDAPELAALLDPDRFDELIWARLAAAGLGPAAARAAAAEIPRAVGTRRAALLDWLRFGRAAESLPVAEAALKDADWRARRSAAGVLGGLFGDEGGDEPGRVRLLKEAAAGTATPESLGRKRLSDLYAALALGGVPTAAERVELLAKSGSPFDAIQPGAIRAFAADVSSSPARRAALAREEKETAGLTARVRADLRAAAADPDDEVSASALDALGGLGSSNDAPLLAAALSSPSAARREAAASGLARLGPAGRAEIARLLAGSNPRLRALAALAAAQSWDEGGFSLLGIALKDRDSSVRAAAVSDLGAAQGTLEPKKKMFLPALLKIAAHDNDRGVRASAAFAVAAISPAKAP